MVVASSKPKVVDLFAGAGLFSLAFQRAGFQLVNAIEQNPVAASTYALNLGYHVACGDVRKYAAIGQCDVIIAGPPCQGFSTLGKRHKDDPRNKLSFEVVRWARALRPKVVVIENVAAFLRSDEHSSLKRRFRRSGYQFVSYTLNAEKYGTPQKRSRSFTLAFLDEIEGIEIPQGGKSLSLKTVRDAWQGLSKVPDGNNHHYAPKPSEMAIARMRVIPLGGDKRDVMKNAPELSPPSWWKIKGEVTDAWGRMHWDKPCNTLRTALQNASKGRYIHPEQNRVISLREAARLHTIPDNWSFDGSPTQIARQIGNSVPPSLGAIVAQAVMKSLR